MRKIFVKKLSKKHIIKFPKLYEKITNSKEMLFRFDCGSLWHRKNVSRWDDIDKCLKVIEPKIKKHKGKIKNFTWAMLYEIPFLEQIQQMKKFNLYDYEVEDQNLHYLDPIWHRKKENCLYIAEDLLVADDDFISLLVNKIDGLKKICFWSQPVGVGFLETNECPMEFIQNHLKHKNWWDSMLNIKEPYDKNFKSNDSEFGNDLDSLLYIKKNIHPKIKIGFAYIDKDEKKILKKHGII